MYNGMLVSLMLLYIHTSHQRFLCSAGGQVIVPFWTGPFWTVLLTWIWILAFYARSLWAFTVLCNSYFGYSNKSTQTSCNSLMQSTEAQTFLCNWPSNKLLCESYQCFHSNNLSWHIFVDFHSNKSACRNCFNFTMKYSKQQEEGHSITLMNSEIIS